MPPWESAPAAGRTGLRPGARRSPTRCARRPGPGRWLPPAPGRAPLRGARPGARPRGWAGSPVRMGRRRRGEGGLHAGEEQGHRLPAPARTAWQSGSSRARARPSRFTDPDPQHLGHQLPVVGAPAFGLADVAHHACFRILVPAKAARRWMRPSGPPRTARAPRGCWQPPPMPASTARSRPTRRQVRGSCRPARASTRAESPTRAPPAGRPGGRREAVRGVPGAARPGPTGPHRAQPAQPGGGQHRAVQGPAAQFAVPHPLQPGGHVAPDPGEGGPGQGLGQEPQALGAGADDRLLRGVAAHHQQVAGRTPPTCW